MTNSTNRSLFNYIFHPRNNYRRPLHTHIHLTQIQSTILPLVHIRLFHQHIIPTITRLHKCTPCKTRIVHIHCRHYSNCNRSTRRLPLCIQLPLRQHVSIALPRCLHQEQVLPQEHLSTARPTTQETVPHPRNRPPPAIVLYSLTHSALSPSSSAYSPRCRFLLLAVLPAIKSAGPTKPLLRRIKSACVQGEGNRTGITGENPHGDDRAGVARVASRGGT